MRILIIAFCLFTFTKIKAQYKFEVSVKTLVAYCKYQIKDNANNLENALCSTVGGGVYVRYNKNKNWYTELGVAKMEYTEGIGIKQDRTGESWSNSDDMIFIPISVGYNIMPKRKFNISPILTVIPSIKNLNQDGSSATFGVWDNNGNIRYRVDYQRENVNKNFFLLFGGGIQFDYTIGERVKLGVAPSFYQGITRHAKFDVSYIIDNSNPYQAKMYGRGSFSSINFSIAYLFNLKK